MAEEPRTDIDRTSTPGSQAKLTPEQYEYLKYCEQYYWMHGVLPKVTSEQYWSEEFQQATREHPKFTAALESRRVPVNTAEPGDKPIILTDEQLTVANIMLDIHDKRSRIKKLTELGISTATYNSWLREPTYRAYCLARAEDLLISNQAVAHLSLINRVEQGDLGAIKYFNALTGRFREAAQAAVQVNVNQASPQQMIIEVVEIIQRHVKDPEVLDAIAGDILALAKGNPVKSQEVVRAEAIGV